MRSHENNASGDMAMKREGLGATMPGRFDFGLSEAQEMRAARLHRESIVFDMISQGPGGAIFDAYPQELKPDLEERMSAAENDYAACTEARRWPLELSRLGKSHLLRDWYEIGGLTCAARDVPVHDGSDPRILKSEERARRNAEIPWLRYVTTAAEIREAKRTGVVAMYANYQPATPAPRDLKAFDSAYGRGLRSFMLTYNRMDHIGVGCTERVDAGLSMFGVDVVRHCNELGMIVDVSHCGHLTTMDACRHSEQPVTANHTSARSIHAHARSKSDEALRAIADTGGIIGVVAVPSFISSESTPTINRMLDHFDYIANLVGWRHVAIGTDWPLSAPEDALVKAFAGESTMGHGFRKEDRLDFTQPLLGFSGCRDLPNITRGLVKRGYSDEQIRGILGQNALRVFEAVCG